ncbi:MAG: penicillin-binding transpeptidase domain-containing protein [Acidimicrobiales bacterium]
MNKRITLIALAAVAAVALIVGALWFGPWSNGSDPEPGARPGVDEDDPATVAADAFAAAWRRGTLAQAPVSVASGDVAATTAIITAGLTSADQDLPQVAVTKVARDPAASDAATATARVSWQLDGGRAWTYPVTIPLVQEGTGDAARWVVAWTPSVVEPSLQPGEVIATKRLTAERGRIVDGTGTVLSGAATGTVTVGIRKSRTTDPAGTARTVAALTGVDEAELVAKVAAAGPDDFVEVITLPRPDYDEIRAQIQPLPGTVFREDDDGSALPKSYARALLGTTGPADADAAAASGGRVVVGDVVGLSGLQASQDAALAGTPGVVVEAVGTGDVPTRRALKTFEATPGRDVVVTLDQEVQQAADAAVATTATPSALVAIRVSTGDVLAVANGPANASAYNRALIGRYPPGSTFKVASGLALLLKGITPDTPVPCPATIVVGKEFRNASGEVLGTVPFRTDFAESCNTAFVGESERVTPQELTATAALLGYRDLDIGIPVRGGSVPGEAGVTEHAANMIGQGKVEASPFVVALASASVANGSSVQPRLIVDPGVEPEPGAPLPPEQVVQLRELMRAVVTSGTGTAVRGIPGGDVYGKTGTAEYGDEDPPKTHAWFTGYQGDVAFAVLVEDGSFGGSVAAPVAARFLTDLAG